MNHQRNVYCGNPSCGKVITDRFVHYSEGIDLFFHYKSGCAFKSAELYPPGQLYERRSLQEALEIIEDKRSKDDLRL